MGRASCVTIACGLNVGDVSNVRRYARAQGDVTLTARSALGNAEQVSADTNEISAEYARRKFGVNVSHSTRQPFKVGHHGKCETTRGAQSRSMPEAAS